MGFCECGGEFSQYREIGFYFFGTRHSHVENVEGANGKELGFFLLKTGMF